MSNSSFVNDVVSYTIMDRSRCFCLFLERNRKVFYGICIYVFVHLNINVLYLFKVCSHLATVTEFIDRGATAKPFTRKSTRLWGRHHRSIQSNPRGLCNPFSLQSTKSQNKRTFPAYNMKSMTICDWIWDKNRNPMSLI